MMSSESRLASATATMRQVLSLEKPIAQAVLVSQVTHTATGAYSMAMSSSNGSDNSGDNSNSSNSSNSSSSSSSSLQPPKDFNEVVDEAISSIDEGKLSATGEPLRLTLHAQEAAAKTEAGIVGQSAHTAPQAALRTLPQYNPSSALTRILDTTAHQEFDNYWKAIFRDMAPKSGGSTITAQQLFDTVADAARHNPHFSTTEANSVIELLRDEIFGQMSLQPSDPVRLPYSK